jgi:arginase family enzyme
MNSLVFQFSGAYAEQGFLPWLEKQAQGVQTLDFTALEGCCCYCDEQAAAVLKEAFPKPLPRVRWLDSGDYHYLSHLLALRETEPFHLILLDNHPDNQDPAFGGVLSCGSWVKEMQEGNPLLRDVLSIGPPDGKADIPGGWLEQRRGERVYVSLDKDVLDRAWARTDWSQGTYSLEQVKEMLGRILEQMEVVAVDICGELAPSKGATPEDLRINKETNMDLHKFLTHYLN